MFPKSSIKKALEVQTSVVKHFKGEIYIGHNICTSDYLTALNHSHYYNQVISSEGNGVKKFKVSA